MASFGVLEKKRHSTMLVGNPNMNRFDNGYVVWFGN
jgi:hypothetical protein